ncbi:hypothetical protein D3C72_1605530 [compost metagenome]
MALSIASAEIACTSLCCRHNREGCGTSTQIQVRANGLTTEQQNRPVLEVLILDLNVERKLIQFVLVQEMQGLDRNAIANRR